jgi:hypothetical protein
MCAISHLTLLNSCAEIFAARRKSGMQCAICNQVYHLAANPQLVDTLPERFRCGEQ